MESILFTLDVFFMVLLVWAVFRAEKKAPQFRDLGFFAYRDLAPKADTVSKERADA